MGRSLEVKEGDTAEVLDVKDEEPRWEEERKTAEDEERRKKKPKERTEISTRWILMTVGCFFF